MTKWKSRAGVLLGIAALVGWGLVTDSGRAVAQGVIRPVQALIINDGSEPVPVVVEGALAVADEREPFQDRLSVTLNDGVFQGSESFTVPDGKRLVVQFLAVSGAVPPDQGFESFFTVLGDESVSGGVPLHSTGLLRTSAGDRIAFAGGGPVLIFAEEGELFRITLFRESSVTPVTAPGLAGASAFVSGYLEPTP